MMTDSMAKWCVRWGLPAQAMNELQAVLHEPTVVKSPKRARPLSEAAVLQRVRMDAPHKGIYTWRNNMVVAKDESGRQVRGGLANDSREMNEVLKSADLIGVEKYTVKPSDVGRLLGLFWSIECKPSDWTYSGGAHERAQLEWAKLIGSLGGRAIFATSPDDVQPTD